MNRKQRAKVAEETLKIIEHGGYCDSQENYVDISESIEKAVDSSYHYSEDELIREFNEEFSVPLESSSNFRGYTVENCTTFEGVKQLKKNIKEVVCLNFASAKNPGGGFLNGSQAQEEALTRASALHPCLHKHMDMYLRNRQEARLYYSHDMIYSKQVPVFRDDSDALIDNPYNVSVITSAAVNAGVVMHRDGGCAEKIRMQMLERARFVLSIAISKGYKGIVLGAWGCGVFRNDPNEIAEIFWELLENKGYKQFFEEVFFAVLDRSNEKTIYHTFNERFTR